jgi:hypothetical protein
VTDDHRQDSLDVMATVVTPQPRVYQHRPVLVIADLADLRGPTTGTAELPIWLFWSGDPRFSIDDPVQRGALYRTVLREARKPADLTGFLNKDILVQIWPDLSWWLPPQVQAAWEEQHPALAATGRNRGDVLRPVG